MGGAAIAAQRLHRSLLSHGVTSKLATLVKSNDDKQTVRVNRFVNNKTISYLSALDKIPLVFSKAKRPFKISPTKLSLGGHGVFKIIKDFRPDIINLHWINSGMLNIKNISKFSSTKPILWTLHDMWAFTGGCHYSNGCANYQQGCGLCPLLKSNNKKDLTRQIFKSKSFLWKYKNFTLVSPSNWLKELASTSPIFLNSKKINIPNGVEIDLPIYQKNDIIEKYGFNKNKRHVLILTHSLCDRRKGAELFMESLNHAKSEDKFDVITIGGSIENLFDESIKIHNLGYLDSQKEIRSIYAASDVFVLPSKEDNFPNTILESLSVGTPVVAFNNSGGASEIIDHKKNGYLVNAFNAKDLAEGIRWTLNNSEYDQICKAAYNKIKNDFTIDHMTNKYINLYQDILRNTA